MPGHTQTIDVNQNTETNLEMDILRDFTMTAQDVAVLRAALDGAPSPVEFLRRLGDAFRAINAMHEDDEQQ